MKNTLSKICARALVLVALMLLGAATTYAASTCALKEKTAGSNLRCDWAVTASGTVTGGGTYSVSVDGNYPVPKATNGCNLTAAQCSSLISSFSGKVISGLYSGSTPNAGCGNHYAWSGRVSCPSGSSYNAEQRSCIVPPPVDQCSNIAGVQATIPSGMTKNSEGECHNPSSCPAGYIKSGNQCERPLDAKCTVIGDTFFNDTVTFDANGNIGASKTYMWDVVKPSTGEVVAKVDGKKSKSITGVKLDVRGEYDVRVQITAAGQTSTGSCKFEVTDRPLTAQCTSPAFTNNPAHTWRGVGLGGTQSTYTLTWKRNGTTLGSGTTYSETFSGYGNKTIELAVRDNTSGETTTRTCTVAYGQCASDNQCTTGQICRTDFTCGVALPTISTITMDPDRVNEGQKCKLFWTSQNAVRCNIVLQNGTEITDVGTNNSSGREVDPGTYKVRCFNSLNESVDSPTRTCILSGNVREF